MGSLTVRCKSTPVLPCRMGQGLGQVARVSDKIYHVPNSDTMSSGSLTRAVTAQVLGRYHLQFHLGARRRAVASKLKSRWTPLARLPNLSYDTGMSRFFLLGPYLETKQGRSIASLYPHPPKQAQHKHALCSHAKVTPAQSTDKLLTFPQAWVASSRTDCLAASFEHY